MRSPLAVFASLTVALAFAACGGGQPAPSTPTPAAPSSSAAPPTTSAAPAPATSATSTAAVPTVWSPDFTKEQAAAFMKANVMPKMGPVFQSHDAKRYGDFSCKTCHGPKYQVPRDYLPHLTLKDGKITSFADKPEISKWMVEKVAPEMAAAMGLPHYDPATKKGFGCAGCHTIDMK